MNYLIGILNVVIVLLSLFLIGIILIQRGKGGGLAGAFGGVGGSRAFVTKAGDVFTKITVGIAIGWILLLMMMVIMTNQYNSSAFGDNPATSLSKDIDSKSNRSKSKTLDTTKTDVPASPSPVEIPAIPDTPVESKSAPTPKQ